MRALRGLWIVAAALVITFAGLAGFVQGPVHAQDGNALQNAGFDGAYTGRGNISGGVPEGWQAWGNFQDSDHESLSVLRISAPYSWRLRSNSSLPTGGGYQTVSATPGTRYRFSIYALIWTCDDEQYQCRDASSTWSDTASGGRVRVGIDPNGGTNPYASGVVWSSFASPMTWGSFGALSVEATASGGQITVFTFYTADRGMRFNDVFWDDASLIAVGAGGSAGDTDSSGDSQPPPATAVPVENAPQERADGALVHIVQPGQTLWAISRVYGVPVETLMALNNMSSSTIYVGQEIVVQAAPAVPTAVPTITAAPFPTAAPVPTAIAQEATLPPLMEVDADAPPAESERSDEGGGLNATTRTLVLVIAGVVILGAVVLTGGLAVYIGYRVFRA